MNIPFVPAAAMLLSLCPAATFVYVGNADSNDIHVMSLNHTTGELSLVEKVEIPGIVKAGGSTPLASVQTSACSLPPHEPNRKQSPHMPSTLKQAS